MIVNKISNQCHIIIDYHVLLEENHQKTMLICNVLPDDLNQFHQS